MYTLEYTEVYTILFFTCQEVFLRVGVHFSPPVIKIETGLGRLKEYELAEASDLRPKQRIADQSSLEGVVVSASSVCNIWGQGERGDPAQAFAADARERFRNINRVAGKAYSPH